MSFGRGSCLTLLALAGVTGHTFASAGEATRGDILRRIDQAVEASMKRDRVPGVSIAIEHKGELLVARGFGFADLENQVPATEHTVYRIGSVTKQYTAAAILTLAEQGRLSLEDPIEKHLPDFPTGGRRITVAQLLDHTSGIKGYTEMPEFWEKSRLDLTHEEMTALMASAPFEFEPGEGYQYNNSAYYLAGLVIEAVSGRTYAEFLEDTFFEPLGLFETHYLDDQPIIPNRAEGYALEDDELVNDEPLSMRLPYSAGSLGSSATDLLAWQRALTSGRVVSPESFERMTTPSTFLNGDTSDYALGLGLSSHDGHRKIAHGGGINGFLSQASWYPEDELFVIVLANSTSAHPGPLANQLARLVLGIPDPEVEAVVLSEEGLRRYVGTYHPGRSPISIVLEDGSLSFQGQALVPVGNHTFVPELDPDTRLSFEMEDERATLVRIETEGTVTLAPRRE